MIKKKSDGDECLDKSITFLCWSLFISTIIVLTLACLFSKFHHQQNPWVDVLFLSLVIVCIWICIQMIIFVMVFCLRFCTNTDTNSNDELERELFNPLSERTDYQFEL